MDNLSAKQGLSSSPGVIDILSNGFDNINRVIWVILLPLMLDLFLWKGPQLSIAPFLKEVLAWYSSAAMTQIDGGVGASMTAETLQSMERLREILETAAVDFNILSVLVGNGPMVGMIPGVPSLAIFRSTGPVSEVGGPLAIALLFVTLSLMSVLLGCLYLGLVAQQVRDGRINILRLLTRVWRYWLNAVGFLALILGLILICVVPIALFVSFAFVISPAIGLILFGIVALAVQVSVMLMMLYFLFIGDAIVMSEVGPFRAVRYSVQVVARNFWSVMILLVLMFVIVVGTQKIWHFIAEEPWGPIAAIVGNAYIVSGLTAGRMLFYRNKLATVEESRMLASGTGNR